MAEQAPATKPEAPATKKMPRPFPRVTLPTGGGLNWALLALVGGTAYLYATGRLRRVATALWTGTLSKEEPPTPYGGIVEPPGPVTAGGLGERLVAAARATLGRPNADFWPADPNRACASYVSTILQQVGLIDREIPTCTSLQAQLGRVGATEVQGEPQAGDVVFFYSRDGKLRHTEIAAGGGQSIGTSSREGEVGERAISRRGFPVVRTWRLPASQRAGLPSGIYN